MTARWWWASSLEERKEILLVHLRGKPVAEDVDPLELAHLTPGFSGADLKNLVNEAALLAAREGRKGSARTTSSRPWTRSSWGWSAPR